jgi:hypothetical protein
MLIINATMTLEAIPQYYHVTVSQEMQINKVKEYKSRTPNPKPRSCARVYVLDSGERESGAMRCSIRDGYWYHRDT